jgi:hypothetical protein
LDAQDLAVALSGQDLDHAVRVAGDEAAALPPVGK